MSLYLHSIARPPYIPCTSPIGARKRRKRADFGYFWLSGFLDNGSGVRPMNGASQRHIGVWVPLPMRTHGNWGWFFDTSMNSSGFSESARVNHPPDTVFGYLVLSNGGLRPLMQKWAWLAVIHAQCKALKKRVYELIFTFFNVCTHRKSIK